MDPLATQHAVEAGSKYQDLAWMVLASPLICGAGSWFLSRRIRGLTAGFNIAGVLISFILGLILLGISGDHPLAATAFHWLPIPGADFTLGLQVDRLSSLMTLVVTTVATLVMIYSTAYMHDDASFSRFFCTLSLFVFSMLGIVLADNLVMIFIFWELVGVSSYLLIGFWHERPAAGDAAKKAFLTNRIGDFGFLLGILIIWGATGTVNLAELSAKFGADPGLLGSMAGVAGLLVFMGAMGKSAQFPLHVWLPDAMEGPTPVSALIHAATMVAAGVYMLCRVFFIYTAQPGWPVPLEFLGNLGAGSIIGCIGGFTSLLAALIAVQQNDIKRILAYSTLSQLGYMVMAVGLGAQLGTPASGMYHLVTHAFFKAMLFLGAGSVIHACHHEQDIWKMGGLRTKMPKTFWTFLIGTAALAGLPPFSGFYSKDEVLVTALKVNPILFIVAVLVAILTTFYMCRLVLVAFFGEARSDSASHAHESPGSMTFPLLVLAVPSVAIAWIPLGEFISGAFGGHGHGHAAVAAGEKHAVGLMPLIDNLSTGINEALFGPFNHNALAATMGLFAVLLGSSLAWTLYGKAASDPLPGILGGWARLLKGRFYFDEIYSGVIIPLHDCAAAVTDWADRWLVNGLGIRGLHGSVELVGRALRLVQSGNLQTYTFLFAAGLAVVAWFTLR
jgi:NADH-quinone oxidoreductase subunit L